MMISKDGISYAPPSSTTSINGIVQDNDYLNPNPNPNLNPESSSSGNKRKRTPGNPDLDAEVVALSPRSLMATNRFICEVCNKGFQRDQNLQLHRRGHNLPWKLKRKANKDQVKKKVYICPEKSCVHHDPSRALGDLTGIKKHFSRKHGEKKWKCDKCSKKYAVMSDWKAHSKICGSREYKCDCGTIFSRRDSFNTHSAFCDARAEERMRVTTNFRTDLINSSTSHRPDFVSFEPSFGATNNIVGGPNKPRLPLWLDHHQANHIDLAIPTGNLNLFSPSSSSILQGEGNKNSNYSQSLVSLYSSTQPPQPPFSATALLQKAAQVGSTRSENNWNVFASATSFGMRDFLGNLGGAINGNNSESNRERGEGERRMLLQEDMAYKLATWTQ